MGPIQSPSSIASISQMSSLLLVPSSPILPHIPHLNFPFSVTSDTSNAHHNDFKTNDGPNDNLLTNSSTNDSIEQCCSRETNNFKLVDERSGRCLNGSNVVEISASSSGGSIGEITPDSSVGLPYTPLVDTKETNDFPDVKQPPSHDSTNSTTKSCLPKSSENDDDSLITKRNSVSNVFAKNECEVKLLPCRKTTTELNVVVDKSDDGKKLTSSDKSLEKSSIIMSSSSSDFSINDKSIVLETSFETKPLPNSNRNNPDSIKYECISTESSCDSLINVNNKNNEENTSLLGLLCDLDDIALKNLTDNKMDSSKDDLRMLPPNDEFERDSKGESEFI